jgi:hypothetical protein
VETVVLRLYFDIRDIAYAAVGQPHLHGISCNEVTDTASSPFVCSAYPTVVALHDGHSGPWIRQGPLPGFRPRAADPVLEQGPRHLPFVQRPPHVRGRRPPDRSRAAARIGSPMGALGPEVSSPPPPPRRAGRRRRTPDLAARDSHHAPTHEPWSAARRFYARSRGSRSSQRWKPPGCPCPASSSRRRTPVGPAGGDEQPGTSVDPQRRGGRRRSRGPRLHGAERQVRRVAGAPLDGDAATLLWD